MRNQYYYLVGVFVALCVTGFLASTLGDYPSSDIESDLPKLELSVPSFDPTDAVVRIYRNGKFYCSGVIIGKNYVVTAAHCLINNHGRLTTDAIEVQSKTKKTSARAAGFYSRTDVGLIKGDFTGEGSAVITNNNFGLASQLVFGCGYPLGNNKMLCEVMSPQKTDVFFVKTGGIVLPGMSGGGVFGPDKTLVGLFSAAYDLGTDGGGIRLAHTTGLLGIFGIEP